MKKSYTLESSNQILNGSTVKIRGKNLAEIAAKKAEIESAHSVIRLSRGGKRPGAGRKPGGGKGRTVTSSSITLKPDQWAKLDAIKGDKTRSGWIGERIDKAR